LPTCVDTPMLNTLIIFLAITLLAGLLFFENPVSTRKNIVDVFTLL